MNVHELTYTSWYAMLARCTNKNNISYKYYGGRGIRVCKRWTKFKNFLEDMGDRPSAAFSLDRKSGDKNYFKSNCRWATKKEQQNNTISNRLIKLGNEEYNITQWSEKLHIDPRVIRNRLDADWPNERALLTPVRKKVVNNLRSPWRSKHGGLGPLSKGRAKKK